MENGRLTTAAGPLKRFEAAFHGRAFAPHRHDTYTFALTLQGVQSFDYRGACRHSLPGELVVLHPDELHDGQAGTEDGFRYRGINIRPDMLQAALGGRPLPFIEDGRTKDQTLIRIIASLLEDLSSPVDELHWQGTLIDLADRLEALDSGPVEPRRPDIEAVARACEYIQDQLCETVTMEALEAVTGRSRWNLARDFRALLGTSPYRYVTMRRLDAARIAIANGTPLALAAHGTGFADQAHFTRQFKSAFGVTPKVWLGILDTRTNGTIIQ